MRKIVVIMFAAMIFQHCACERDKSGGGTVEVAVTKQAIRGGHNSRNSLDYWGTYRGTVPCADCAGVRLELTLKRDGRYTLRSVSLDKHPEEEVESSGVFTWNSNGNIITLSDISGMPDKFLVGENKLVMLDAYGNRITGENASRYVLKKE